jgi:hypothetical protein
MGEMIMSRTLGIFLLAALAFVLLLADYYLGAFG